MLRKYRSVRNILRTESRLTWVKTNVTEAQVPQFSDNVGHDFIIDKGPGVPTNIIQIIGSFQS